MLIEGITITFIIGACGLVAWLAKNKFQPEIEQDIQNRKQKTINQISKIKRQ